MWLCVGVAAYVLVAVGLIAYDLRRGGPWMAAGEAAVDVLCCILWPVTFSLISCVMLRELFRGRDGGRPGR